MTNVPEHGRYVTAHEFSERNSRRHRFCEGDVRVTATEFPTLYKAFETISHDSGGSAGHESYFVPVKWAEQMPEIEAVLAAEDWEWLHKYFVLGEATEQEALVDSRPELKPADALLNEFFDDFQ